ncbi:MAG: phosphoglucomutase (alpha-D-glucose-1,6-bisphosphate-dependent) [Leptospirillum sp.]
MSDSPLAGTRPLPSMLTDIPRLVSDYFARVPDPGIPGERVSFGTSGHRGSSFEGSFNERHILAVTQAICQYRKTQGINGPLLLGFDTHALSWPAFVSALEVLAANDVDVLIAEKDEYTPTPVISHAILVYNRGRKTGLADGIVITPSHNPPKDGGFKYDPPHGGPAGQEITSVIERQANLLLEKNLDGVRRIPFARALKTPFVRRYDFMTPYVEDLSTAIDMELLSRSKIRMGVNPLGGAGVHYWGRIAERYRLDLTVVNDEVDPTFRFMTLDWDGQIRMDPSSPYAMKGFIDTAGSFDIAFACDPDHDRHGIVTRSAGLLPPNHYLSVMIDSLFRTRSRWPVAVRVGKTLVSSAMIDRVAQSLGRTVYEVPVGFKWFVEGLLGGTLGFAGEESAGASFLRQDGTVWTTDKDAIIPSLLSAEIMARQAQDPGDLYRDLVSRFGDPVYDRIEAPATPSEKERLKKLSPEDVTVKELAGEPIREILTRAPGNDAPIGGIKVMTDSGWFAARPSGTESIYKIYAESFKGPSHLEQILGDARSLVEKALSGPGNSQ